MLLMHKAILGLTALTVLGFAATRPALAQTTITVGSLQNSPSANVIPFGADSNFSYPQEYQQIYGAAAFNGSVAITSISFASLSGYIPPQPTAATYDMTVKLSETAATPAAPSTIYASNFGASTITVFQGTLTRSFLGTGNVFDFTIPTSSFLYNPAQGNLLMDITMAAAPSVTGGEPSFVTDYNPNLSRVGVYGGNKFADAGFGLVTQFGTGPNNASGGPPSAAPEPSQLAGLGFAGLGVLGMVWKARRKIMSA